VPLHSTPAVYINTRNLCPIIPNADNHWSLPTHHLRTATGRKRHSTPNPNVLRSPLHPRLEPRPERERIVHHRSRPTAAPYSHRPGALRNSSFALCATRPLHLPTAPRHPHPMPTPAIRHSHPQLTAPLPNRTHANARAFHCVHQAFECVPKQQVFSPPTHAAPPVHARRRTCVAVRRTCVGMRHQVGSSFCATHWPRPSKLGARNSQLNTHRTPPHVRSRAVPMRWSADPCCIFFRPHRTGRCGRACGAEGGLPGSASPDREGGTRPSRRQSQFTRGEWPWRPGVRGRWRITRIRRAPTVREGAPHVAPAIAIHARRMAVAVGDATP
jgi:hypothetical protein